MDPDNPGTSQNDLAESWSTQDAQTYVIKLRKDVQWQDGKPFGADDVGASFDCMMRRTQPPYTNPGQCLLFETIDINHNHPLLKQRDFRWAINLIIDRQEMGLRGTSFPALWTQSCSVLLPCLWKR